VQLFVIVASIFFNTLGKNYYGKNESLLLKLLQRQKLCHLKISTKQHNNENRKQRQ